MLRVMHRSKIHDATVTETQLEYAGSITVPAQVGDRVHILSHALMTEEEARAAALNVAHVDGSNQPVSR